MCLKPIMLYVYQFDGRPDSWSTSLHNDGLLFMVIMHRMAITISSTLMQMQGMADEQDSHTGLITVKCQVLQEKA